MKKLIALAALIGATSLSFGQGYVAFNNSSTTKVSTLGSAATPTTGIAVMAAPATATYYFELMVAPTTTTTISASTLGNWTAVALGQNSGSGRMIPSASYSTDSSSVSVAGYSSAATADFAVVGWSASLGTSYAAALAADAAGTTQGYFGISAVALDIPLAALGGPYNSVWGPATSGQIPNMTLDFVPVPEPTTLALAGLGAAALMIFRRRK
jgi:hypothetical protein